MKQCPRCGYFNQDIANYCARCGFYLNQYTPTFSYYSTYPPYYTPPQPPYYPPQLSQKKVERPAFPLYALILGITAVLTAVILATIR
ncbi:hypothetical protein [Stygiolobus caldivivus]|uniref:Zinc-ribbon domain-containing protein n=1 Tax=Stygiolobus caldivivus TaxID=2824673 RepID=A0A8D5U8Y8_9CREN|nr:hypothetical protein [Stygiolobus caldivivus]BCU71078.1 hypothetical protein KN1_23750 [Stygiolobus caldivivus]